MEGISKLSFNSRMDTHSYIPIIYLQQETPFFDFLLVSVDEVTILT